MYRILRATSESRERRRQATHSSKVEPELVARKPGDVYSWDITKLRGPAARRLVRPVRDARHLQPVGLAKSVSGYGACEYSLIRPLRVGRRRTVAVVERRLAVGLVVVVGGCGGADFVVVAHVFVEHGGEVSFVDDEPAVGALPTGRAHPALGVRVGRRSQLHRMRTVGANVFG
jgi:hypothetical protein